MVACTFVDDWYYFVAVGVVTFLVGLVILIPSRVFWYLFQRSNPNDVSAGRYNPGMRRGCSRIRASAVSLLSGNSKWSKCVVVVLFLLNLTAIILYLIEATLSGRSACGTVRDDAIQLLYLSLCCVFTVHYIFRFIAAPDKLFFWIDVYSFVDHFTIGPAFFCFIFDVNWIGLRFLRLLYLLQLPEILQLTHTIKASNKIRLAQIATIFISIWFCSSGFVHLCENNGDPADNYEIYQDLSYWSAVYWLLVTMSTVGFGEISPATDIGRAFIVFFIIGSFAMFTTIIPELVTHLGHGNKYRRPYKRIYGMKHIIVCGNFSYESVSTFIKNFVHEDAEIVDTNVVFLDNEKPNLEQEAFFRRHCNNVTFVRGSVMDVNALKAVKLRDADACLILARRHCSDPDEEDTANIMRATAIKNFHPETRIIIQLLSSQNKTNLLHIPNWNWDTVRGDDVICVSELKMGLLAQNCLAPGVSTLLANLLTMRSFKNVGPGGDWQDHYRHGAGNEIYIQPFASYFVGMSFTQAAEVCFSRLRSPVILIAVETGSRNQLRINPGDKVTIGSETIGFFIAQRPEHVRQVSYYNGESNTLMMDMAVELKNGIKSPPTCKVVEKGSPVIRREAQEFMDYLAGVGSKLADHGEEEEQHADPVKEYKGVAVSHGLFLMLCHLIRDQGFAVEATGFLANPKDQFAVEACNRRPSMEALALLKKRKAMALKRAISQEMFDFTGMYHWCPSQALEDVSLTMESASEHGFEDHVVVCLPCKEDSPRVNLVNFVMPLRTSNFRMAEMKDIVFLGDVDYLVKEWDSISNFPRIFVYPGNPSNRADLRALSVSRCSMCVILSAGGKMVVDHTLLDCDAILTSLNVQSMFGDDMETRMSRLGVIVRADEYKNKMFQVRQIPVTTALDVDSSVQFLDQDDDDNPDTPLYMTQPYANGRALSSSVLDSLLIATYRDSQVLDLLRALVTGAETGEFEQILAEGLGIVRKNTQKDVAVARERCRLGLLSTSSGVLGQIPMCEQYARLFIMALRNYGILCLGLYRLMDTEKKTSRSPKRYVFTNPPADFKLHPTDMVYCLMPSPSDEDSNKNLTSTVTASYGSQGVSVKPRMSRIESDPQEPYVESESDVTRI